MRIFNVIHLVSNECGRRQRKRSVIKAKSKAQALRKALRRFGAVVQIVDTHITTTAVEERMKTYARIRQSMQSKGCPIQF